MKYVVCKLIISALRFLTFSWSTTRILSCQRISSFDLNFFQSALNFRTKERQDALIWRKFIAEICLDFTSFSYQGLPRFDENFFPKSALIWRKSYYFFLVWVDASDWRNFLVDLEVKTFLKSCWSPKPWNRWNMKYFQQFCQIKQKHFTLFILIFKNSRVMDCQVCWKKTNFEVKQSNQLTFLHQLWLLFRLVLPWSIKADASFFY